MQGYHRRPYNCFPKTRRSAQHTVITASAVIGSVARGDFNDASDIDVIIIAENLPGALLGRSDMLYENVPPLIEPKAYAKDEFKKLLSKRICTRRRGRCDE